MGDINKVWLSGMVISDPVLTQLSSRTPSCSFIIQVNEKFRDKSGLTKIKPNFFEIESLGKSADATYKKVKAGKRFTIDGYLRCDKRDGNAKIRTFAVYPDDSLDQINYLEGIKQALEVLRKSRDKNSAMEKLEQLIST